jgi:hypothetical protein
MRNGKQDEKNEIAIEYVIHKQLLICSLFLGYENRIVKHTVHYSQEFNQLDCSGIGFRILGNLFFMDADGYLLF